MAPPYLFLCIYHLPKRHMMSNFLYSFINFCIHHSFSVTIFTPSGFAFFYSVAIKTVFAPGSPTMWTFDEKNLGKRPPPFPHTPQKNLGRRVCVDRAEHTFCGVIRDFFFLNFKNMSGKGTITISGGKNSLIQKLFEGLS